MPFFAPDIFDPAIFDVGAWMSGAGFVTGRQRRLKLKGTITGTAIKIELFNAGLGPTDGVYYTGANVRVDFGRDPATWLGYIRATGVYRDGPTGPYHELWEEDLSASPPKLATDIGIKVEAVGSLFGGSTLVYGAWVALAGTGVYTVPFDTGTYEMYVDVEECYEVYGFDPPDVDDFGYPTWGGGAQRDGLTARGLRRFERTRIGGAWSLTCTCNGVTASLSGVVNANYEVGQFGGAEATRGYHSLRQMRIRTFSENWGGYVTVSVDPTEWFGAVFPVRYEQFWTQNGGTVSYAAEGVSAGLTTTNGGGYGGISDLYGYGYCHLAAPTTYDLDVRLRSWGGAYPGSLHYLWFHKKDDSVLVPCSPNGLDSVSQHWYEASCRLFLQQFPGVGAFQKAPVKGWLTDGSLRNAQDDHRDWRTFFRTYRWNAVNLSQASASNLDNGSSTSGWTAGANTTVSTVGGAIRLAIAGGTGSATRAFSPKAILEGYRYLRVRIRSTVAGSKAWTLTTGGRTWNRTTNAVAGTYDNVDLDLCGADSISGGPFEQDTRWPETSSTDATPFAADGMWGPTRVSDMVFGALVSGETYEIDSIDLVRLDGSTVSLLPAFLKWFDRYENDDNQQVKDLAYLYSDGRLFDEWGQRKTLTPEAYPHRTIAELATAIGLYTGWTATTLSGFDSYHGSGLEAEHLGGAGGTYDGSAWTYWVDRSVGASTLTIKATSLFDEIESYPGAGDWNLAAYGGAGTNAATPLSVAKNIRSVAQGIVLDSSAKTPLPNEDVVVYPDGLPNQTVSQGVTGARGAYGTAGPEYGRGNKDLTTELRIAEPFPNDTDTWASRWPSRTSFLGGAQAAGGPHITEYPAGPYLFVVWAQGGNVRIRRFDYRGNDDERLVGAGASPQVAVSARGRVLVAYQDGANVKLVESSSMGDTWGAALTIAAGTNPALATCKRTGYEYIALHNGAAFVLYRRDSAQSGSFASVGSIVTVAAGACGIEVAPDPAGRLVFVYSDGADVKRLYSSDYGATWNT